MCFLFIFNFVRFVFSVCLNSMKNSINQCGAVVAVVSLQYAISFDSIQKEQSLYAMPITQYSFVYANRSTSTVFVSICTLQKSIELKTLNIYISAFSVEKKRNSSSLFSFFFFIFFVVVFSLWAFVLHCIALLCSV